MLKAFLFYFLLNKWSPNIEMINITKLVQMIFSTWYGCSEYVDYLRHGDCSQLLSHFNDFLFQVVCPIVEHRLARNLQHKTLQTTFNTFDQSQHLCPTWHKSFCMFQLCFSFFVIIKQTMPKMLLFFLPPSVLKWLHKNSPILISFFFHVHWYDSSHNYNKKKTHFKWS